MQHFFFAVSLNNHSMKLTRHNFNICVFICFFSVLVTKEQAECFMTAEVFKSGPKSADLTIIVCFICKHTRKIIAPVMPFQNSILYFIKRCDKNKLYIFLILCSVFNGPLYSGSKCLHSLEFNDSAQVYVSMHGNSVDPMSSWDLKKWNITHA